MKKDNLRIFAAAVCTGMFLGMTACSAVSSSTQESTGTNTVNTEEIDADAAETDKSSEEICGADESTWSPFTDYDSLKEAEKASGIEIIIPAEIDGFDEVSYAAMNRTRLIQIDYTKDENSYICIRKAEGQSDISGDYNTYKEESTFEKDGIPVTLKGNGGNVSLAVWTDGTYSYSIMYADLSDGSSEDSRGITPEQMKELVLQVN